MKRCLKCKVLLLLVLSSFVACKKVVVEFPGCSATIRGYVLDYFALNDKGLTKDVFSIPSDSFVLMLNSKDYYSFGMGCINSKTPVTNYLQDFTIYAVLSSGIIKLPDTCFKYMLGNGLEGIHSFNFDDTKQEILDKKPQHEILCLLKNNTYVPSETYFRFMVEYKLSDGVVGKSFSDPVLFTNSTSGK